MTITELIKAIKEENLSKQQIGHYYDQMAILYFEMQDRLADIEKEEALYFSTHKENKVSDISIQRSFNVTESGLEGIKLHRNIKGVEKLLSSLKRRSMEFL